MVARAAGDRRTAADALHGLGVVAFQRRDQGQAAARLEESLKLAHEAGDSPDLVQEVLRDWGLVAYYQGDPGRATASFQEGYALIQEMSDQWGTAIWQVNFGELALHTDDLARADTLGREAMKRFLALGTAVDIAIALELLAKVAAAGKQSERAARLLGAAMTMRMQVGAPLMEANQEETERETAAARQVLGEEAWATAYAAGRALSLEEAIAEALDKTT